MADAILARQLTEQVTRLRQRQTGPLILELDLTDGIGEGPIGDPLSAFMSRRKARMQDIIDGLRRARRDDRVRALLAKAGVAFQSAKRYEYKSAADNLTERGFTGPTREAAERLAESIAEQITAAIAERRGKTAEQARALLDRGPFLAEDALAEGLVDALGYRDEVYADVRKEAGPDAVLQYVVRYHRSHTLTQRAKKLPNPRERFVAVIYASGPIKQGRSGRSPLGGGSMGSDTVAAALRSATSDDRVRAVLLRINSPGGSAVASDTIWREVVRTRAAGKPVGG